MSTLCTYFVCIINTRVYPESYTPIADPRAPRARWDCFEIPGLFLFVRHSITVGLHRTRFLIFLFYTILFCSNLNKFYNELESIQDKPDLAGPTKGGHTSGSSFVTPDVTSRTFSAPFQSRSAHAAVLASCWHCLDRRVLRYVRTSRLSNRASS